MPFSGVSYSEPHVGKGADLLDLLWLMIGRVEGPLPIRNTGQNEEK